MVVSRHTAFIICLVLVLPAMVRGQARPPLADGQVRGVNHAHIHRRGHGYGTERSAQTLDQLRGLGVNWIAITPFGYQKTVTDDHLRGFPGKPGDTGFFEGTDPTMTDADIAAEIRAAHQRGIKVLIKPHVWSDDYWNSDEWHGTIHQQTPAARRRWWRSYRQFIMHYTRLAAKHEADALCLGTELVKMTAGADNQRQWRSLIADARDIYDGHLTYAAHWDREFARIDFWDELDVIGVTAYFPLKASPDASLNQLVQAWRPHCRRMERVHRRFDKPIVFLEAGYRPVSGAHRRPWEHNGGTKALPAQRRAYRAMFRALSDEPWWRGVLLWKTFTDPGRAHGHGGPGFAFRGRPAERVVERWFARQ